jgi:hypothetical protein
MKLLWLLLVLLLPAPVRTSQDLLPELVRRIKPSAVAIETFDARGQKLSRASGFFVDIDRIVTNRHVLEGAHRAEVHSSTGAVFSVKGVIAVDAEGDIALLKIDTPRVQIRPLPLDKTSPQEGESIVVIGNPLGLEGSVTNGIVSAVRDIPTFGRIIQITAPISSGSSGSPVVNMQGQVIGIATLQITGGQSVNFAIPSERISQLQIASMMTLSDLVTSTGRNKRAKAVQFFRDGLSFLSKDDCEKALPYFERPSSQTINTLRRGPSRASVMRNSEDTQRPSRRRRKPSVSDRQPSRTSTSGSRVFISSNTKKLPTHIASR